MFDFLGKKGTGKGGEKGSLLDHVQDQPDSLLNVVVPFPGVEDAPAPADSLLSQFGAIDRQREKLAAEKQALEEARAEAWEMAAEKNRLHTEKEMQEKAAAQARKLAMEEADRQSQKLAELEASKRFKDKADFLEQQIEQVRAEKIRELTMADQEAEAREAAEVAMREVADAAARHAEMQGRSQGAHYPYSGRAPTNPPMPPASDRSKCAPAYRRKQPVAPPAQQTATAHISPAAANPYRERAAMETAHGLRPNPQNAAPHYERQPQAYSPYGSPEPLAPQTGPTAGPRYHDGWRNMPPQNGVQPRAYPYGENPVSAEMPNAGVRPEPYPVPPRQQEEPGLYDPQPETDQNYAVEPPLEETANLFNLDSMMRTILRSWKLIAFMAILGAVVASFYAMTLPNKYQAWAELIIDPSDVKVLENQLSPSGYSGEAMVAYLESQLRIIESSSVLNAVIEDRHLLDDEEFNAKGSAAAGWLDRIFPPPQSVQELNKKQRVLENLQESLTIVRGNRTFIYSIGITTSDPVKSAEIANSVAEAYVNGERSARSKVALDTSKNLKGKLDSLLESVTASERKVADYRKENEIFSSEGKLTSEVQLSLLNEQLAAAKVATINARARMDQARGIDLSDAVTGALSPSLSTNTMLQLRVRYAALKSNADRLATKLGSRHPELIAVQAELGSARKQISQEIRRIVTGTGQELKRAQNRQRNLKAQVNRLKADSAGVGSTLIKLHQLEREAAAHRRVYEKYLLRTRETAEQDGLETSNARIISDATAPLKKAGPQRKIIAIFGLVAGAMLGLLLAIMKGLLPSLRKPRASSRPEQDHLAYGNPQAYGEPGHAAYPQPYRGYAPGYPDR